ncbi:MAG: hypothetical protein LLG00_03655 [Planctomycetaceae bacterium]|nr:hypothetical protein [Planctomycetaceae bacterium]
MAIFVESPWPWLLLGIALETALAIVLLQTKRGAVLWAMLGTAVLVAAGLFVERLVITDREAIENTLDAAVAAVEHNDINRLLACISPSAQQTRGDARWMLGRVDVRSVWVRGLEVKVNRLTSPWTADARFTATGSGKDRKNEFPYDSYSQRVLVKFQREGDRWLVTGYSVEGLESLRR